MTDVLNMIQVCNDKQHNKVPCQKKKYRVTNKTASTTMIAAFAEALAKEVGDRPQSLATTSVKKCEGQQSSSSLEANSCSSRCCCCKPAVASRSTEMAQEDSSDGPSWDNLPIVILQEIFSYLPHESRIKASQACKNWRYTLFHPSFWKKIAFVFKDEDSLSWVRFMVDRYALSVQEATIRWNILNSKYIDYRSETYNLLKKLGCNRQLRKLFLEFNNCIYDYFDYESNSYYSQSLREWVVRIIETSNCLEVLSLGCSEELAADMIAILEPLRLHHAKHLTQLNMATVKDDPDHYKIKEFDNSIFDSFTRLSILTLDHEFVSDTTLKALENGCLKRLVIHIHCWRNEPWTTNRAWQKFVQKNPQCELRLNLIHSYFGVKSLDTEILRAAMPLTHLKVLFCESVNVRAMLRISLWYSHTLKSLTWIDSVNRKNDLQDCLPYTLDPNDPMSPDPMVLIAWKCTKLSKIMFLGRKYYDENLLAIVRLRESNLKMLVIAKNDITFESYEKHESTMQEIQKIMGSLWTPLNDSDLPPVILDPFKGDSRDVIMPLVLKDQK
ncbi:PREDICTED: F-box only protein 33 [Dinoponera quadriceps]|uniref:F-box only protein 33 n=1 Tax=Dinoponera quadriceps TaxID=609295 RepID=A0A6P3XM59_DINQU|nr:PREDICTED: F-box only protein 33 [Dinoponera quadriceps]